jgi:leucyl-tRNA synthetase
MWYMRITQYADELVDALDGLGWPEQVKQMQRNWIGRSHGVEFTLPYDDETARRMNEGGGPRLDGAPQSKPGLRVFTTRADTIMGITFAAVAAEHPLAAEAAKGNAKLAAFIEECKKGAIMEADLATQEKKGMATGLFVRHPFTGERVEVWIGNYVLMGYGGGAVMAVPGHDERDFAFAKRYGLAIKPVIDVGGQPYSTDAWQPWYEAPGKCVNSGKYDGLDQQDAIDAVAADLGALGLGAKRVQFRLRDWGISRQRYWGTPIPIIECGQCGDVAVPDDELPVVLPEDLVPDGSGSPLAKSPAFYQCKCPKCGGNARRDTDTMDTFVDSSWYYMRYTCPDAKTIVDERAKYWMPMDQYIGGIEHAILHLLYARFWTKVMRDMGLIPIDEPFKNLLTQGMVLNHIYSRRTDKGGIAYFAPEEVEVRVDGEGRVTGAVLRSDGKPVDYGGIGTMSKSKRNGVDPQEIVDKYGADTARLYVMFASPPTDTILWSDASVEGSFRFLKRLWKLVHDHAQAGVAAGELPKALKDLRYKLHRTIEKVADDYGRRLQFNTAIAAVMELLNALSDAKDDSPAARAVAQEVLEGAVLLLSPIVPHAATKLWEALRPGTRLIDQPWPAVDAGALVQETVELVLQVNGKLRGHITVSATAPKDEIEKIALASDAAKKFMEGKPAKKVVVVPGRLVNVVV